MPDHALTADEAAAFRRDGFLAVRGAIDAATVRECRDQVETAMRAQGVTSDDPLTWNSPVVRVPTAPTPAAARAAQSPPLVDCYAGLLAGERWDRPVTLGGTVPVRFPHPDDPGDAGWHVDAGFINDSGMLAIDRTSRGRALICLVLLDNVGSDDAPTDLLVGSHRDLPAVLEAFGDEGADFMTVAKAIRPETFDRPVHAATGGAGDVYVCHPFLVHRATWPHRGEHPRAVVQSGVTAPAGIDFAAASSAVAQAVS